MGQWMYDWSQSDLMTLSWIMVSAVINIFINCYSSCTKYNQFTPVATEKNPTETKKYIAISPQQVGWLPRGVLNRNLGRGVRPTQRNPDPVQDTKDVNFATLCKRKCCNFLTCSRLYQAGRFKTLKMVHKFAFSHTLTKEHEISENYAIEGGKKEKICVKLYTLFKTEAPKNDTLTVGTSQNMKDVGLIGGVDRIGLMIMKAECLFTVRCDFMHFLDVN